MKRLTIISLTLIIIFSIYNTNFFQANFTPNQYYKPIFEAPFDPSKKGERLLIPITFKYRTEYELLISIPKDDIMCFYNTNGTLNYRFTSRGKILEEGRTKSPSKTTSYSASSEGPLSAVLLRFNLPFPEAANDLVLVLEVVNPLTSFSKYSGSIMCIVRPSVMK